MDDDDLSLPERLEQEVRFLEEHPEIDVVGCSVAKIENESVRMIDDRPLDHEELMVYSLRECPVHHSTVMMRRKSLNIGGFRYTPNCIAEDYELWCRMIYRCKFANIPDVLLYYRNHKQNITNVRKNEVVCSHLEIMRQNLAKNMGLFFSREQMLLFRWPSIISEALSWRAYTEYKNIITQICQANLRLGVYNQKILEHELRTDLLNDDASKLLIYNSLRQSPKLFFYGAGRSCERILGLFMKLGLNKPKEIWDLAAEEKRSILEIPIVIPPFSYLLNQYNDAIVVVTIENPHISKEVKAKILSYFQEVKLYDYMETCLSVLYGVETENTCPDDRY